MVDFWGLAGLLFPMFPICSSFFLIFPFSQILFLFFYLFLTFSRFQATSKSDPLRRSQVFDLFARVGRRGLRDRLFFGPGKGSPLYVAKKSWLTQFVSEKSHDLHKEMCWEILRNSEGHSYGVWGRFLREILSSNNYWGRFDPQLLIEGDFNLKCKLREILTSNNYWGRF